MTGVQTCALPISVLSINDHPDIRACFHGFEMEQLAIDYMVGGGHNKAERKELVIYSWRRSEDPPGLF